MTMKDVGARKAIAAIVGSFGNRYFYPVYSFFRILGFLVLMSILYLYLVADKLGGKSPAMSYWIAGYALYLLSLEYACRKFWHLYDTTGFRSARIVLNTAFFSWLITIAPPASYLLAFLYAIPLLSAVAYKLPTWFKWVSFLGIAGSLYLSTFVLPPEPSLTLGQYGAIMMVLVSSGIAIRIMFQRAHPKSAELAEIIRDLHQKMDLNQLMEEIVDQSVQMSAAAYALIFIFEPEKGRYITHACRGLDILPGRSLEDFIHNCQVVRSGESFETPDLEKLYGKHSIYKEYFGIQPQSVIAEAIINREGKVFGAILLFHERPNHFEPRIKNKITRFSSLVGSIVENHLIDRQAQMGKAKSQIISRRIPEAGDEKQIVSILVEEAKQIFPKADGVVVHRFEAHMEVLQAVATTEPGRLLPWVASDIESDDHGKTKMGLGVGIAGHSLKLQESILVPNINQHPWFEKSSRAQYYQSLLVAPLIDPITCNPIGTVSLYSRDAGAFNYADEVKLVSLAYQASNAISQSVSFTQWREHGGQLKQVLDEVRTFDLGADEETLCRQIARSATKVLGFRMARIRLVDQKTNELVTTAFEGVSDETFATMKKHTLPVSVMEPFFTTEFKAGQSFLVPQEHLGWKKVAEDYFYVPPELLEKQNGWKAYDAFLTPLNSLSGQMIGLLTLDMPETGLLPSAQLIEAVGVFASAAAWALEMSAALKQIADQTNQMKDFIQAISENLARSKDIKAVGEVAVQAGVNIFAAEGCSFFLIKGNILELANSSFLSATSYIGRKKPVTTAPGCGLTAYVAATGTPMLYQDLSYQKHEAWAGEIEQLGHLPSGAATSLMIVPIKSKTKAYPLGVLSLENKKIDGKIGPWDKDDFQKLIIFAEEVGRAIEIVERYKAIETLEHSGLEDDIHDLLNWFQMGVALQIDSIFPWLEKGEIDRVKQDLGTTLKHARTAIDELKTIHTAITYKYLEEKYLSASLQKMADAWKERVSRTDWILPITVECPEKLEMPDILKNAYVRIASSAVANCVKHSGMVSNPEVKICVKVWQRGTQIILQVIDNGKGASDMEWSEGYGITRMRYLVENLKKLGIESKIEFQHTAGVGTTVTVKSSIK